MHPAPLNDNLSKPPFAPYLDGATDIAVAVSGGPDSMALIDMLSRWAAQHKPQLTIHALTVDHGLRAESKTEAASITQWLSVYPNVKHIILDWHGEKPTAAIQENARQARYDLMAQYCADHAIKALMTAHHQDDQAETVLFRLAKGSGLTGLCGMQEAFLYNDNLSILRPLLAIAKQDLIAHCAAHDVPFVHDPSNTNDAFARVRLRQSAAILAEEGLSNKRLATTAMRLRRAENALQEMTEALWHKSANEDTACIVLDAQALKSAPDEIALRLIIKSFHKLRPAQTYLPRMEKIENLCADLQAADTNLTRTLGGLKFVYQPAKNKITITPEESLVSAAK